MSLDAKKHSERQAALATVKAEAQRKYDVAQDGARKKLHEAREAHHRTNTQAAETVRRAELALHRAVTADFYRTMAPLVQAFDREGYPRPLVRDFLSAVKVANERAVEELGSPLPVIAVGFAFAPNYPDAAVLGSPKLWESGAGCLEQCAAVWKAVEFSDPAAGELALRPLERRLTLLVRHEQGRSCTPGDRERLLRRFEAMKSCATDGELTRQLAAFDQAEQEEQRRAWAERFRPREKTPPAPEYDDAAWSRIERAAERLGGGLVGRLTRAAREAIS